MTQEVVEKNIHVNGIRLCYFERGISLRGTGPTLLFLHATGFHARIWDQIIARLPPCHIIAIDQRGHGRSEKVRINHWQEVVADASQVMQELELTGVIGIGHSMGAHALLGASALHQDRVHSIVAVDPVIAPEEAYDNVPVDLSSVAEHPMARRRSTFDTPEEMMERLLSRGSYGLFDPQMLNDYCHYGLLPSESGGYQLACPPDIEASVYMTSRTNGDIYDAVRSLQIPVSLLRAKTPSLDNSEMDFSSSPTWPGLINEFPNAEEHFFSDKTHFLPMEIPDEVAAIIEQRIQQLNVEVG
jgi:lipase